MYRRLARNTAFNTFGRLAAMASAIILTPFILSSLGEERFAIWSLTTLFTSYIGFLDFGIGLAYSKYIAEYHARKELDKINGVIVCGIGLYILISIFVIATGHFLILLALKIFGVPAQLQIEAQTAFWIALIVFSGLSTFSVFEAVPVGLQRMEYNNLVVFLVTLLYAATSVIYLQANGGLIGLMLIRASATALQIVLMYLIARRLLPTLNLSPRYLKVDQARELISFGVKVQAGRLANLGTLNVNRVLIGIFVGLLGVTSYQIGHTIVQGIRNIAMLMFSAMVPLASQIDIERDHKELLDLYHTGTKATVIVAGAGFGLVASVAAPIIVLWTGQHYPVAVTVIIVLALANYIHVSTGTGTALAKGIGNPGLEARFGILLLLGNALLGWIFGRHWGIDGILLATLIAYVVSSFVFLYLFNQLLVVKNTRFFRNIMFAPTVLMLFGIVVVRLLINFWPFASSSIATMSRINALRDVIITGSIFAGVYLFGLLLLGYLRLDSIWSVVQYFRDIRLDDIVNRT